MLTRLVCAPLLLLNFIAGAYLPVQTQNFAVPASPERSRAVPFTAGETLVYEVTFSKLLFSGTIGSLTLTVGNPESDRQPEKFRFRAEGTSKGFFTWLFKINVHDKYSSQVSPNDFGLESSSQSIQEGRIRREQTLTINRVMGRATYAVRNLAQKTGDKVVEADSPRWAQDLLSSLYYVRTLALKEGDRIALPLVEAAKLYNVDVVVGKKAEIVVGKTRYDAIELDVKAFDGRYIKRSGQLLIWVTEDAAHVPVKARIRTSGYTVNVDLIRSNPRA